MVEYSCFSSSILLVNIQKLHGDMASSLAKIPCCNVSKDHHKNHVVHLKLSVAATIQFEIHLWCWDSKNTSVTVSTWWTVPGWLLVYFVSWHLGWISNWIAASLQLYLTLCLHTCFFSWFFEALQQDILANEGTKSALIKHTSSTNMITGASRLAKEKRAFVSFSASPNHCLKKI
jgi:hypothetical protein